MTSELVNIKISNGLITLAEVLRQLAWQQQLGHSPGTLQRVDLTNWTYKSIILPMHLQ